VDNGTGNYTFTLSAAMGNANFCTNSGARSTSDLALPVPIMEAATTSSFQYVYQNRGAGTNIDVEYVMPLIQGDLA